MLRIMLGGGPSAKRLSQIHYLNGLRIHKLKGSLNSKPKSVLGDPSVIETLAKLHENFEKYVIVPADNFVFVCKTYYYQCLIHELGIDNTIGNSTYTLINVPKMKCYTQSFVCSYHMALTLETWIWIRSVQEKIYCWVCYMFY